MHNQENKANQIDVVLDTQALGGQSFTEIQQRAALLAIENGKTCSFKYNDTQQYIDLQAAKALLTPDVLQSRLDQVEAVRLAQIERANLEAEKEKTRLQKIQELVTLG